MTKVLILDHSKSMRNNLRERLEFEGYSTEGAADGARDIWEISETEWQAQPITIVPNDYEEE